MFCLLHCTEINSSNVTDSTKCWKWYQDTEKCSNLPKLTNSTDHVIVACWELRGSSAAGREIESSIASRSFLIWMSLLKPTPWDEEVCDQGCTSALTVHCNPTAAQQTEETKHGCWCSPPYWERERTGEQKKKADVFNVYIFTAYVYLVFVCVIFEQTHILWCVYKERIGRSSVLILMSLRQSPLSKLKIRIFPSTQPVMTRRKREDNVTTSLHYHKTL